MVTCTEWTLGSPGMVGSNVEITYCDGSTWVVKVTSICDKYNSIAYEVINTNPVIKIAGVETEIQLFPCSFENTTFVRWTTEYSNDATASVIQDAKYKKHEFFKSMKAHLAKMSG